MSLGNWLWGQSQIDEAIDKATSELMPVGTEDIALNLEICDQIRSKSVQPKDAMRSLKRRLNHKNPNVQLLTLQLTDICVKNGGDHFLVEIASREFQDNLVSILKMPALNQEVKQLILRLIQNWGIAFEDRPGGAYVSQVYKTLQNEGFSFPPRDWSAASAAMVTTQTAPEWIDSDVCLRCRAPFTFTNRKHHCRNCGQVFDQQCSSKSMPLPHYGINVDVRVCNTCYNKLSKKSERNDIPKPHSPRSPYSRSSGHRSGRSLADEELQRAIELSLQEANAGLVSSSAPSSYSTRPGYAPSYANRGADRTPPVPSRGSRPNGKTIEEEEEEQLQAAIKASLMESNPPSRAAAPSEPQYAPTVSAPSAPPAHDLSPHESDAILSFSQSVDGVPSPNSMGRISSLYTAANSVGPKLTSSLEDTQRKEAMLAGMNDKLSEVVQLYEQKMTIQAHALAQAQDQLRLAQQQQQQAYAQQQWQQRAPSIVPQQPQQYPYGPLNQHPAAFAQPTSPPPQTQTPTSQVYPSQTPYQQSQIIGLYTSPQIQTQQPYAGYQQPKAIGSSEQTYPAHPSQPIPQESGAQYPGYQSQVVPQTQAVPQATPGSQQGHQQSTQVSGPPLSPQQVQIPGSYTGHHAPVSFQPPPQQQQSQSQVSPPSQQVYQQPGGTSQTALPAPPAPPATSEPAQQFPASTPALPAGYQQTTQPTASYHHTSVPTPSSPPYPPQVNGHTPTAFSQHEQQYQPPQHMYQAPANPAVASQPPVAPVSSPPPPHTGLARNPSMSVTQKPVSVPQDAAGAGLTRSATIATPSTATNKYAPLQALQSHVSPPIQHQTQVPQQPQQQQPPQQRPIYAPPQQSQPQGQAHPAAQQQPHIQPSPAQLPQAQASYQQPQSYVQPNLFPTAPTTAPQAFQAINGLVPPPSSAPYGGIYGSDAPRKSDSALIEL